jgi:Lon-like protease
MRKFLSKPVIFVFMALALLALLLPQNFAILAPGPTTSLLDGAIKVAGHSANLESENGKLFSVAILATGPKQRPRGYEVLYSWLDGNLAVVPRDALYSPNEDPVRAKARQRQELLDSQASAAIAALNFISKIPNYPKPNWGASDVSINLKNVGGGSAGLAFALALIAKTADPNLILGRNIAATGTIAQNGSVGEIGGVDQKVIGAKKSGVQIFIIPKANCASLTKHPSGVTIYAVSTLSEAVHALAGGATSSFACPKE